MQFSIQKSMSKLTFIFFKKLKGEGMIHAPNSCSLKIELRNKSIDTLHF